MSTSRAPEPPLDPPDPDWALFWYRNLTALNSFGTARHEREADARENMRCARNVDAPLAYFDSLKAQDL